VGPSGAAGGAERSDTVDAHLLAPPRF